MIALGWCFADQRLPAPLKKVPFGKSGLIVADPDIARTAAARLGLLQAAFDEGADVLPLAPARLYQLRDAFEAMSEHDVHCHLSALAGRGQLTLCASTSWPDQPDHAPSVAPSGRHYLRSRLERYGSAMQHSASTVAALTALSEGLTEFKTVTQTSARRTARHVLLPREAMKPVLVRLSTAAKALSLPAEVRITLSGLWPALHFADLTDSGRSECVG